jgi:hypothetical protein
MSVYKCSNNKFKYGASGKCVFETRESAEAAGKAIEIAKIKKMEYEELLNTIYSYKNLDEMFEKIKLLLK